ncbi:MAG: hypothetical protein Q9M26_06545, partial [Mariprofundales bacterium]|nr:hypothetical protein [Mariprofundales bacterium]
MGTRFFLVCGTLLLGVMAGVASASAAPVDLDANQVEEHADGSITARGDAHVVREGTDLYARSLTYQPKTSMLDLYGQVYIDSPEREIHARSGHLDLTHHTGHFHQVQITLVSGEHAQAVEAKQVSPHHFTMEHAKFTVCPPGDAPWWLYASHADLDQDAGVITLHNARFVMGGVPLLYSPYWQYPLKRRSGMLLPEIGFGKRRGT